MRTVHGRSARVLRAPTFEANDRLKFTAEEQRVIQTAERAFGYRPHPSVAVRRRSGPGLALAIAFGLAYLLFSTFVVVVLHSFLSPDSPRENQAPMAEVIQREPPAQAIPSGSIFTFQNQASINQTSEVMSQTGSLQIQPQEEIVSQRENGAEDWSKTSSKDDRNERVQECGEGLRVMGVESQRTAEASQAPLIFGSALPYKLPHSSDGSLSLLPDENGRVIFVNDNPASVPK